MKKRIFNWHHSKNKKYAGKECPSFDFIEGCKNGTVIWWNEQQFCVDMDKLKKDEKEMTNEIILFLIVLAAIIFLSEIYLLITMIGG